MRSVYTVAMIVTIFTSNILRTICRVSVTCPHTMHARDSNGNLILIYMDIFRVLVAIVGKHRAPGGAVG